MTGKIMDKSVKIFKALGDKNRTRIIKMLEVKPLCVCEITSILSLATSTVSKHLSILREAGLIVHRKDGKWVEYDLKKNQQTELVISLMRLLHQSLKDDPQILADRRKLKNTDRMIICKE